MMGELLVVLQHVHRVRWRPVLGYGVCGSIKQIRLVSPLGTIDNCIASQLWLIKEPVMHYEYLYW